jgi:dephospho-CoA kinase
MKRPLIVGITGGIGSGKSTVCKIFQSLRVPVTDADSRARFLMNHDDLVKTQIISAFGNDSYKEGLLNRNYIAQIVFNQPEKLALLNSITHPAVARDFEKWLRTHLDAPYVVKEAALLIEAGAHKSMDMLILVTAPEEVRVKRVLQRDPHRSEEEIKAVMQSQMPEEDKGKLCDVVIENDGNQPILQKVLDLHNQLMAKSLA